jgi:hypothetical protein
MQAAIAFPFVLMIAAQAGGAFAQTGEASRYLCNDSHYVNSTGPLDPLAVLRERGDSPRGRLSRRERIVFRTPWWDVLPSRWRGPLVVITERMTYRLQYLGAPTGHGAPVLGEASAHAANMEAAIREPLDARWLPGAYSLRLVDLDGREVYERSRIDRS